MIELSKGMNDVFPSSLADPISHRARGTLDWIMVAGDTAGANTILVQRLSGVDRNIGARDLEPLRTQKFPLSQRRNCRAVRVARQALVGQDPK